MIVDRVNKRFLHSFDSSSNYEPVSYATFIEIKANCRFYYLKLPEKVADEQLWKGNYIVSNAHNGNIIRFNPVLKYAANILISQNLSIRKLAPSFVSSRCLNNMTNSTEAASQRQNVWKDSYHFNNRNRQSLSVVEDRF